MNEDDVARSAQLALLLEVSAYPKPGNVDRTHDFIDTSYEHFLASSVALYSVLREAAVRGREIEANRDEGTDIGINVNARIGELVRKGVEESAAWQNGGNTHFGALLLLIPLAVAAGACKSYEMAWIKHRATEIMLNTTMDDAIEVYKAFPTAKVNVRKDVPEFDLRDEASIKDIREKELSLYEILTISAPYDLISRELVSGFELTFRYAREINDLAIEKQIRINETITRAYLQLLSEEEDTFISMKFGPEKSRYVNKRAKQIVENGYERKEIEELDAELIMEGLNPGSTADIIAAALFIGILGGLRF